MDRKQNKTKNLYRTGAKLFQVLFVLVFTFSLLEVQPAKPVQAATTVNLSSAGETYLRQGYPTRNYGGTVTVSVSNGTNKQNSLYKWDLSTIPEGSTVTSASITFRVTDASTADFSIFAMRRAWVEGNSNDAESSTSANYNTYDGVNTWGTAGAMSTTLDRFTTDLWDATGGSGGTFSATGDVTIPLNTSGVEAVQGWVTSPSSNHGLTMQFTGTTGTADYWIVASKENTSGYTAPTLNVTYEAAGPTIITTGTLQPFNSAVSKPSAYQTYQVSGDLLNDQVTVTAPEGFQVANGISGPGSLSWGSSFTTTEELVTGYLPPFDVYVRLNPTSATTFSGNITHTSPGATTKNVAVTGSSVPTITTSVSSLAAFATPPGTPSAVQTYTVSGINLTDSIDIGAPGGFETSQDGTNWVDPFVSWISLSPTGGVVPSTTIYVHMTGASEGTFYGDITHDSSLATQKDVAVTGKVSNEICITSRISAGSDDVEQRINTGTTNGDVDLDGDTTNSWLQMFRAYGGSTTDLNWWGLRFLNVNVPVGATITSADVTFQANATSGTADSGMTLWGQLAANPPTFTATKNDVSGRTKTTSSASWVVPQWTTGSDYASPDLAAVVQEIVSQGGWAANNAMVIIGQTTVSQNRTALSYNSSNGATLAPLLEVCYTQSTDPMISTSGTLAAFATLPNVASDSQSYTVSGMNLTDDLLITAPTGFQLSLTSGGTYGSTLNLTPEDGAIPSTPIYVRLLSATVNSFGGDITHTSGTATQKNVAVTGTVSNQICYENVAIVASEDTYMSSYNTTFNYGGVNLFKVTNNSSGNNRGALLRWDLESLPDNAVVSSASLKLYVSTASTQSYNLYEMMQGWVEGTLTTGAASTTSANWQTYDGVNDWGTPGAASVTLDRYNTNLWSTNSSTFTPTGSKTIPLNSDGVFVVQEWITAPANNLGVTMQSYSSTSGSDDLQIASSENTTEANRPTLIISYCVGNVVTYTLTVGTDGHGTVNLSPSGNTYAENQVVTLTPVPASSYQFSHWTGTNAADIIKTAGVYTIAMTADKSITANFSQAPNAPMLDQPADNATDVSLSPLLRVNVSDPDKDTLSVSFYGRPVSSESPTEYFTFIAIPDTQTLASSYPTTMSDQFSWIASNIEDNHIVFVTSLGDIVNSSTVASQWTAADTAYDHLDTAGVPYSVGPGNHDTGGSYSTYFGNARFSGKSWYQGYYTSGTDNYNNYSFFSAGGMDFIVINLEVYVGTGALDWADALLKANPTRRGIVVQHDILNINNSWNNQASFTALSDNPNLFLMLCGHMHAANDGSAYRLETRTDMNPVHILLTDYQDFGNSDYMRLLEFNPSTDTISAGVYSPNTPGGYLTDAANYEEFTMSYEMEGTIAAPFELIGTVNGIASGSQASITWAGRTASTEYEWYAVASDGSLSTDSSVWSFTTGTGVGNQPPVVSDIPDQTISEGSTFVTITLDNYVVDPDDLDAELLWSYSGASQLGVTITNRVATISIPNAEWNGNETITFRATDPGTLYDEDAAIFTVTAVNDPPLITAQAQVLTVPEETALDIMLAHLSVTDVDNDYPEDFTLTVMTGSNYQLSGNTITPDFGFYGELTVPVKVNDGDADSNTFNLTVTVTQGGVTPVLPSNFWGYIHFAAGDPALPTTGDILYVYLDAESTAITNTVIGYDSGQAAFTYAVNVPSYADGTHPTTVTFKLEGRVLATAPWNTGTNVELDLHPPMADAGGPYVRLISAGTALLDGTVSDWGSDVIAQNWDLDEDGGFDDSALMNPTFSFTAPGTYLVSLKAVDSHGGEGADTSQVFAINLGGITGQVYNGSPHPVTVAGVEEPFDYQVLYGDPESETPPTNAGTYDVLVEILSGSDVIASYATQMTIAKATATVTLGSLSQTYDGTAKAASATTVPAGLTVNLTYIPSNPVNAGNYAVTATVVDANYQGTTSGTLVIGKATATVTLGSLSHTYDGTTKAASATTTPTGLTVNFEYDPASPVNAGSYAVTATVADTNYTGTTSGTLVISKATATVTLGSLSQTYDGATKAASATTTPTGLTVNFVYDPANPVNAGSYAVTATVSDTNYSGTASGTLVIGKATATVTLSNLNQTYDGTQKSVTVTTVPAGLAVVVTYEGSTTPPSAAGSYAIVATVNDSNYLGSAEGTLVISGLSHSIELVEGWNLVSFNLIPNDPDIEVVLADILDDVTLVYAWNGETGTWMRFDPAVGFGDTLTTLIPSQGFWINMEVARTLTVLGTAPTTTDIGLYEGWNLIGWPSDGSLVLPDALTDIGANYRLIMAYHANETTDPWKLFDPEAPGYANDLLEMAPGWGYWINMTAEDILSIDY